MTMRTSVLIPCFNGAAYLAEALDTVLAQTLVPFEIILVDDGSTDATEEIARRYAPRVRYDPQPHRGIAATRNRALQLAQGDTFAFLDADDLWPEDSLACRARLLRAAGASRAWAGGLIEEFISPELDAAARAGLTCRPEPMAGRLLGALLMQREAFERVGRFDESQPVAEAVDWVARADAMGLTGDTVNRVVLRRRIHLTNNGQRVRSRASYLQFLKASIDRRRGSTPPRRAE